MTYMARVPFIALVAAVTGLAALLAVAAVPGRPGLAAGVAMGTGLAGGFAALAVAVFRRIRARVPKDAAGVDDAAAASRATQEMAHVFAGLMLVRMLAYLALIMAAVVLKFADAAGVGAGLVAGTIVFQILEVIYLRKMS